MKYMRIITKANELYLEYKHTDDVEYTQNEISLLNLKTQTSIHKVLHNNQTNQKIIQKLTAVEVDTYLMKCCK